MLIGWAAQNLAPSQHITKWILGGEREWTKETPYSRIAIRVDKIHSMDQAEEALWRRRESELLRKMWAPPLVHLVLLDRERNGIGMFQHSRILSLHLRPFSPFRFFPPSSFFLTCMKYAHTHSLAPSCFPPDRYLGPSFSFIGPSPSSSSETSRLTWNLKEKTLLLKKM
jgi:hypothetical protein